MVDYVAIGRRVKKFRNQANLTQADVAEKLGISVSYVSQIECGRTDVSLKRLDDIANIIHTRIELLIADPMTNLNINCHTLSMITKNWSKEQSIALNEIVQIINSSFVENITQE